jgi:hypothetical protein
MSYDEMIVTTLSRSKLAEDLQHAQLEALAEFAHVRQYLTHGTVLCMDAGVLQDALLILVKGEIAISGTVDKEHVALYLEHQGDMARILSFVGGNVSIAATITVKRDSTVLLIKRTELEAQPRAPYAQRGAPQQHRERRDEQLHVPHERAVLG